MRRRRRRKTKPEVVETFPELVLIPQEHVTNVWNLCDAFIEIALEGTEFSAQQMRDQAARGDAQLWFIWSGVLEAALITEMWNTPSGRVCAILALGGKDMSRWLGLHDVLENWARSKGAVKLRIFGRKGWARMLPDYQVKRIVLDKDI